MSTNSCFGVQYILADRDPFNKGIIMHLTINFRDVLPEKKHLELIIIFNMTVLHVFSEVSNNIILYYYNTLL